MPSIALDGSRIRATIFSPNSVGQVLTRKSIARFLEMRILMRPSCGHAALGDVEPRHDLDARGELDGQLHRRVRDFFQVAVEAQADAIGLLVRLEVDVRRAFLDGVQQHLVDEAHDRRVFDVVAADRVLLEILVAAGDVEVLQVEIVVGRAPASACRPARSPWWRSSAACPLRRRPLRSTGPSGT